MLGHIGISNEFIDEVLLFILGSATWTAEFARRPSSWAHGWRSWRRECAQEEEQEEKERARREESQVSDPIIAFNTVSIECICVFGLAIDQVEPPFQDTQ